MCWNCVILCLRWESPWWNWSTKFSVTRLVVVIGFLKTANGMPGFVNAVESKWFKTNNFHSKKWKHLYTTICKMYAKKTQDKVHKQKCFKISQKWAVCFVKIIVYNWKLSCVPLVKLAEVVQTYSIFKSERKEGSIQMKV